MLKGYRTSQEKDPWKQTKSTENNAIERFWPEMNSRVNYPIKRAMIRICEEKDLDTSEPVLKYCFSWISIYVATAAAEHLIKS